jgi:cytochrome c oxidase subunit 2
MTATSAHSEAPAEPHHGRRILGIWVVLSVVCDVLFAVFAASHIPPGKMSSTADGQQFDFNILFLIALPVLLGVFIYLAYAAIVWRASRPGVPESVGGEAARSNIRLQMTWMVVTTVMVMGLFVFGTYELVVPAGAGGGEGPAPIWTTSSHTTLPIQVIGQQWKFTYRYPTFGGFETQQLIIPVDTPIAFHVTSLDVIHSFWAYQLGVKADANPASDNVAFTTPKQLGQFTVRCSELCGLWHGAMYNTGSVVTKAAFATWAQQTEAAQAASTKLLPAFAYTYVPDANGADGGYYPDDQVPYSNVEQYGAQKPAK